MPTRDNPDAYSISVIMPVYNDEAYVETALASIAAQSHRDFEVIVVDDGSTDRSAEIVAAFCRQDPRFTLLKQENSGVSAARNRGIAHASGEWIALCDADDYWHEDKLERQLIFLKSHTDLAEPIVALGALGHYVNNKGRTVGVFDTGLQTVEAFMACRQRFGVVYLLNSSVLFRKDVFLEVGEYNLAYDVAQDVELWTRMAARGIILNVSEVLACYRVHGDSASDKKFVKQMLSAKLIAENARRRAEGQSELDYDTFITHFKRDRVAYRKEMRMLQGRFLYRRAGGYLSTGKYLKGIMFLAGAFLIAPRAILGRLQRQLRQHESIATAHGNDSTRLEKAQERAQ